MLTLVCACYPGVYNASKSALIQASEAWRMELAPLGVHVITLLTGGVSTNFLANLAPLELPDDSYYLPVKDIIEEKTDEVLFGVSPETFAQDVVRHVERGATGKIWVGGGVGTGRAMLLSLMPQCAVVSVL